MSQNITLNGNVYIIPDVGETGWGQNLTNYFVAIPAGVLQKSAGLFTLTADVDFGANFGVKSLYYKTETANDAASGQVRLAKTDTVSWRNNANGADLALGINGSDVLTFNGNVVPSAPSSYVASITGTANQVVASAATGAVTLSLPQSIATTSSPTFAGLTISTAVLAEVLVKSTSSTHVGELYAQNDSSNGVQVGSFGSAFGGTTNGRTNSGLGFVEGDTSLFITTASPSTFLSLGVNNTEELYIDSTGLTLVHPLAVASGGTGDASFTAYSVICAGTTSTGALQNVSGLGLSGQVLTSNGASALPSWTNAPGTGTVNSGTQYQLAYYATSTNAVSGNSGIVTNANQQLIIASDTASLTVDTSSNSTTQARFILKAGNGSANIASRIDFINAVASTTTPRWVLINDFNQNGTNDFSITDASSVKAIVAKQGGATAIHGTTTNDNASSGYVGETVTSSPGSYTNFPASGTAGDYTSISLTAGDWLVSIIGDCLCQSSTHDTFYEIGINTTAGNVSAGNLGDSAVAIQPNGGGLVNFSNTISVPSYRMSLATTTTVYLKYGASYTSTAPKFQGRISAVRIR